MEAAGRHSSRDPGTPGSRLGPAALSSPFSNKETQQPACVPVFPGDGCGAGGLGGGQGQGQGLCITGLGASGPSAPDRCFSLSGPEEPQRRLPGPRGSPANTNTSQGQAVTRTGPLT